MLEFLGKYNEYNRKVTKSFVTKFQEGKIVIGDLKIPITEGYIAQATRLSQIGERYHRGKHFKGKYWNFFLQKYRKGTFNWKKGVIRTWF